MSEQDEFGRGTEPGFPFDVFTLREVLRRQMERGREARDRLAAQEDYKSPMEDLSKLEAGVFFEYPVVLKRHLPGIGYLVADHLGNNRSYWLAEDGITSKQSPKARAVVRSVDDTAVNVYVQRFVDGSTMERSFYKELILEGIADGVVSILDDEESSTVVNSVTYDPTDKSTRSVSIPVNVTPEAADTPEEKPQNPVYPEVGMRVEIPMFVERVIENYAALVQTSPDSKVNLSIRVEDVTLFDEGRRAKVRGTVVQVKEYEMTVEFFSPSDQYQYSFPFSQEFKDVTEPPSLIAGNLYKAYTGDTRTMLYDGEWFIPVSTYPEGKKSRAELPKRLQELGHLYDNM